MPRMPPITRGDHALVADDPPDLRAGRADRAQQAELARALVDGQIQVLAMPNSEISTLMASSA